MSSQPHPMDPVVAACQAAILSAVTQQHMGLEEAAAFVRGIMASPDHVDIAYAVLKERQRANRAVTTAVVNPDSYPGDGWYLGSVEGGQWAKYRDLLLRSGSPDLNRLDEETEAIVSLLAAPNSHGQKRKGLVMGNVQSGKTRSFAGVIAKAADAGYRLVIVLSGMHNNLREQTQARLSKQLFYEDSWYPLTGESRDFGGVARPEALLRNQPLLCAVVKKNSSRLHALVQMMKAMPEDLRRVSPVLIVDDEADQATPNSLAERQRISAINKRLRDLWGTVVSGTYLAYTATPFANILMDPDDDEELFPSDFISTIDPGDGYFGAERVFGLAEAIDGEWEADSDGLDVVRKIPATEAGSLRPPSNAGDRHYFAPELPSSLLDAYHWFVVATAIRRARGQSAHSSMLVHTTHYTRPHFAMQSQLVQLTGAAQERAATGDLQAFRDAWDRESSKAAKEATVAQPTWDEVVEQLPIVLSDIEVIVDNGSSLDRLNYDDDLPRTVVAVGGGTLSRGLTLEGLVVSYFTRTSNTYDTLMQMGRWFGYRSGYEDLPRVWVTDGLDDDYAFLARVESDLREEIRSVQGSEFTPREVGVKIRAHPGRLQVTSANRMFHAEIVQLGLSGAFNQTFILDGSEESARRNQAAVDALVQDHQALPSPGRTSRPMFSGVHGERVAAFLDQFMTHPDQVWLYDSNNRGRMREWVEEWASGPLWNIVLMGVQPSGSGDLGQLGSMTLGGITIGCLNRSALLGSTSTKINLKAIMSQEDRICDIEPARYANEAHSTNAERRRIRRLYGEGRGLIVIYPISKDSRAGDSSERRMDLPVHHHLLGFAIFFPSVNDTEGTEGAFVSVRPEWEVPDAVEGDDEFAEEEEVING